MIPTNRTYAPLQALVDELARCGLEHAVTSPGSRNAPLSLTLAAEPRVRAHSVVDERAAGFVALGIAKATERPVAVTCTSGTAAANLMPAVVEAHEAGVPLIVLTADRPPELREVGAGQAIDQLKLYGAFAKWFVEVGNHEPSRATAVHFRALGCRAFEAARGGRPGPVHLNFPLREPLAPVTEEGLDATVWEGRADGAPWVQVEAAPARPAVDALVAELRGASRGVFVCGAVEDPGAVAPAVAQLAEWLGWPVLADATSGLRRGREAVECGAIAHYDVLLRSERFAAAQRPDLVVRVGATPTSKPLRAWLEPLHQVVVDPHARWDEPTRSAEVVVRADPARLCAAAVGALLRNERGPERDSGWLRAWCDADAQVPGALAAVEEPFEPALWTSVADAAPPRSTLWVASSMPIRDVEALLPRSGKPLTILANRGANGIDGTVAAAAGAALARPESRTYVLLGDLALVHDAGGLLAARRLGAELTVVCANNGGGGIFDFLPVAGAADPEAYERHIATPADVDLAALAAAAGMSHTLAASLDDVRAAVERPGVVELRTDRAASLRLHRELYERVAASLG
ncbi:MAG TPA: 2-succinyl-5-enolpyruvyl-6-hydroxy-3-cyclohexene-1-carboxylic-acid synthase [Thermoleophilaceae bacterium]|nr:2-succinyl-5-enolpyruvyl-6-hydroxy-3-cyclohexene-1-carboxylic-acid synthase [Thermoleophilaceae bacterium]